MRCEPADTIIKQFGGLSAVAQVTGVTPHSVMRWRMPRADGGTGGTIPAKHADKLLQYARANEIAVTADSFFASAA